MSSNPLIDTTSTPPRIFMKDGKWSVPRKMSLTLPVPDCSHPQLAKWGRHRNGSLRVRCRECGKTQQKTPIVRRFGMYTPETKQQILAKAFAEGLGIRGAARLAGVAEMTAKKFRHLTGVSKTTCPCGGPAGHRGWCWWRVQRSTRRQSFLRRWGKLQ